MSCAIALPYTTGSMLIGLLLVGCAAISWGTTGATMTLAAREAAGPLLVGWARLAVAAPCLLAAAWLAGARAERSSPRPTLARVDWLALGAAGAAMAAYQLCFFSAVTLTGVAVAALLAICSAPILIALLARLALGERLPPVVRASLALSVAGTGLLVVGPRGLGEIAGRFGLGALLALGAGLSYAVYAVGTKRLLVRIAPLPLTAATFSLAALLISPALLAAGPVRRPLADAWLLLVYLGVVPTALAYLLFTAGLRRVPATAAGIASLLEPLTATTLGVVVFGESLGAAGIAGALLLLGGLAILVAASTSA
jgi:drug/metabolite transporter, DME family